MGAARRGVKISCDQRGNIEGTEWNLIFSTLHCTPRRVAIDRNMSTAVLYNLKLINKIKNMDVPGVTKFKTSLSTTHLSKTFWKIYGKICFS